MILSKQKQAILFSIVVTGFIALNVEALQLPFYWDEAWSYAVAVFDMHTHGLAFLPGQGNVELTRGHPLLFYDLAVLWTKLFGTHLLAVHAYSLFVSCMTLYAVYLLAFELSGFPVSAFAVVIVMLQPIFLAQSTMLLPEMMLTIWSTLTMYFYLKRNWFAYILFSILLVMTKETGIVLIAALLIDRALITGIFYKEPASRKKIFTELSFLSVPLLVFMGFITIQKIRLGWFLFPQHLNMMTWNPIEIMERMILIFKKLLTSQGRMMLLVGSVIAMAIHLRRKSLELDQKHFLLLTVLILILYTLFYAMNFFTTRYLLVLIPLYTIAGLSVILPLLRQKWLKWSFLISMAGLFGFYSFTDNHTEQDVDPEFKKTVLLQQKVVHYAEEQKWQNKLIYSAFLMQYYMGIPELGYLIDTSSPFYLVKNKPDEFYDVYIFCSNENDPNYPRMKTDPHLILLRRFSEGIAWVEIYGRKIN